MVNSRLARNAPWTDIRSVANDSEGAEISPGKWKTRQEMHAECMREHGGFDHNRQSLRVVELLEAGYPDFPGLNLTFEVREGLQKHEAVFAWPGTDGEKYHSASLEAQVANLADEITYYS